MLPPVLWAVAYTLAKPATAAFPPLFLASRAYGLTAVVLFKPWTRHETPIWAILAAATLGASVQSALIFNGIARVEASVAILVVQSQVPFAVFGAWTIAKQPLNWKRMAGSFVALCGIALVVGLPALAGQTKGLLLIVLGTLSWGIGQGIIAAASRDSGARFMGALAAVASPQLLLLSLITETGQWQAIAYARVADWTAVVVLAVGGFVAAYSIWYGLLQRYNVDQIAPFVLLMPVAGLASAFIFLGERPTWPILAGGAIITLGVALVVLTCDSRKL